MVTGCGSLDVERSQPLDDSEVKPWEEGRFLGSDIFQFTFNREEAEDTAPAPVTETVNVNGYLWRASLDTVSFLPIASADPFGGLIITDWYTLPESSEERFRVNIYIRGRVLRTNALKVSVFRQVKDPQGQWVDRPGRPRDRARDRGKNSHHRPEFYGLAPSNEIRNPSRLSRGHHHQDRWHLLSNPAAPTASPAPPFSWISTLARIPLGPGSIRLRIKADKFLNLTRDLPDFSRSRLLFIVKVSLLEFIQGVAKALEEGSNGLGIGLDAQGLGEE